MSHKPLDLEPVARIVDDLGRDTAAVVPILQAIQNAYRYLPQEALERVCDLTEITPATIAGVSTFYDAFRHRPVGRHLISVCHGTACHVKGSQIVQQAIEEHLGLSHGQDTSDDGNFTVVRAACFGCCMLAPVIRIEQANFGHLRAHDVAPAIAQYLRSPCETEDPL